MVLALVFVFIKFPSCKGAPAQQQQLPTESMGPTLKRLFAIPRFRLGILSQFCTSAPGWRMELHDSLCAARAARHQRALRDLLAAGFSGDLRRGKNRGHLVDEPSESGDAARNVCPGRHRPVTDCRFQRFNAGGLCAHSGQLLYGAMLADELWSGDQGMGKDTQTAGSIVVMSIIGGAVIPLVMGIISDMNGGNMQIAFIAPLLCFVYVAFYGFWCVRKGV